MHVSRHWLAGVADSGDEQDARRAVCRERGGGRGGTAWRPHSGGAPLGSPLGGAPLRKLAAGGVAPHDAAPPMAMYTGFSKGLLLALAPGPREPSPHPPAAAPNAPPPDGVAAGAAPPCRSKREQL